MLILPVGLEDNTVRRTPWVTWVIIGLCFSVFLLLLVVPFGTSEGEVEQRFDEALRYLAERPYLTMPDPLRRLVGRDGEARLLELRDAHLESDGEVSIDEVRDEQEQLDALAVQFQRAIDGLPVRLFGFVPTAPQAHALVTSLFMHAGWLHLLGNMLFLFMSGPFIEDAYGRPLYAALYFITGFAGTAAHVMAAPESSIPLVGASGAISGVMGAFLIRYAARRIVLLVLPIPFLPFIRFNLRLPAFVVLPLWIGEQVLYASLVPAAESGVAFWAHIGGFLAGACIAIVIRLARVEERFVDPAIEKQISLTQHPGLERAIDARAAGDLRTAEREIAGVLAAEPQNPDAWLESWEIALAARDGAAAGKAGLRLLEIHGRSGEVELCWSVAGDSRWQNLENLPMRFVLAAGEFMGRHGDGRAALACYRIVSSTSPTDALALRALVAEGEVLARAGDSTAAKSAFAKAGLHPAWNELWAERMERALHPPAQRR